MQDIRKRRKVRLLVQVINGRERSVRLQLIELLGRGGR
jgi:hypothetical protein